MQAEKEATGSGSVGPWMDYIIEIANDHPYLWALYAIALVSPFVLCAACCVRAKPSSKPRDEAAERKKTDAPSPDDPRPLEEKKEEESFVAPEDEKEEDTKTEEQMTTERDQTHPCLLYTSPSPRDRTRSRMPSSA